MNTTVREHIQRLEKRRNLLNARVMEESNSDRRNQLETELRAVESALKFHRGALQIESRLVQAGKYR
jgi:hypothetical protein